MARVPVYPAEHKFLAECSKSLTLQGFSVGKASGCGCPGVWEAHMKAAKACSSGVNHELGTQPALELTCSSAWVAEHTYECFAEWGHTGTSWWLCPGGQSRVHTPYCCPVSAQLPPNGQLSVPPSSLLFSPSLSPLPLVSPFLLFLPLTTLSFPSPSLTSFFASFLPHPLLSALSAFFSPSSPFLSPTHSHPTFPGLSSYLSTSA